MRCSTATFSRLQQGAWCLQRITGRSTIKRRAGPETCDAEADPACHTGKAASGREASDAEPTDRFRRGIGDSTHGRGEWTQHGKPCRVAWHAPTDSPRGSGRAEQSGGEARSTGEAGVMPVEGRSLSSGAAHDGGEGTWGLARA